MADLSTLIEYDRTHAVKIRHPITGLDSGIVINVVSSDSARVVEAQRKAIGEYWSAMAASGKGETVDAPDNPRLALIHCIDSWDWGEQSFAHISGSGSPSVEDRAFLIDHPNAKWIRDQLAAGCANIENFTNPSREIALSGSKKT